MNIHMLKERCHWQSKCNTFNRNIQFVCKKYLDENIRAIDVNLTDEEIKLLEKTFPAGETVGERYPVGEMKHLGL